MGATSDVYGFTIWIASWFLWALYMVWAFVPDSIIQSWGVTYYPDKYWAVVIPLWLILLVPFLAMFYTLLNLSKTNSIDSKYAYTDDKAISPPPATYRAPPGALPQIHDMDLDQVNRMLYC